MTFRLLCSYATIGILTACMAAEKKTDNADYSALNAWQADKPDVSACDNGDSLSYVTSHTSDLNLNDHIESEEDSLPFAYDRDQEYRFDLCLGSDDSVRLQNIVVRKNNAYESIDIPSAEQQIEGYENAVFSGDFSGVNHFVEATHLAEGLSEGMEMHLHIIGIFEDSQSYLLVRKKMIRADGSSYYSRFVGAFAIKAGDFQSSAIVCSDSGFGSTDPFTASYPIGPATLAVTYCLGISTPGGWSGSIKQVTITDSNENLGPEIAGKAFPISAADQQRYDLKTHHHNICDSIQISLSHATYQITSGAYGVGGDEEVLESCTGEGQVFVKNNAPEGSAYRIVYQSNGLITEELEGNESWRHWGLPQ